MCEDVYMVKRQARHRLDRAIEMEKLFVIVAVMHNCEMFISSKKADISDSIDGAIKFKYGVDCPNKKAKYFNDLTGFGNVTGGIVWEARAI